MTDQGKLILAFLQLPGIGRKTVYKYMLPSPTDHYDEPTITRILHAARAKSNRIKDFLREDISIAMSSADHILDECEQLEIKTVAITDANFPARLHQIDDPPVLLYYRGSIDSINENHTIAIIGTREPTEYGYRIAIRIGEMMAEAGIVTVSGLALGCDTGGHTGTVNKNGTSVALLANGLDTIYPKENQALASEMLDLGGCLISEYPPKAEMQRGFFVDRDRLQAALSDALFVVETDIQGGTMHTVHFAQQYKKQIYCFNHPDKYKAEKKVQGNQKLILDKIGLPVTNAADISRMITSITEKPNGSSLKLPDSTSKNEHSQQISMWPV